MGGWFAQRASVGCTNAKLDTFQKKPTPRDKNTCKELARCAGTLQGWNYKPQLLLYRLKKVMYDFFAL